ncbi:hypothetical protein [Amycolatopsis alkalitolerans]|uniref:Chromosome segregation ATPase n=1 Tax=Amycolatopsis alkalitolerans TaxID=2547244 RepID=A0A5C4M7K6_9PSEU|nr:hypothetical protein [Amycolatopsis alkalitolerans]TNC29427.1 hypothetical protein FG385_00125 [Amycolatopsis alkalitolerans]
MNDQYVPKASNRGIIGSRHLIAVQTFDVARLTTHPVPVVPGTFIAVSGEGPRGDSNGSGKTSFLAVVSILLGDPQWRFDTKGGKAATGVLFRPDSAGVSVHQASPARSGYIVGVFADEVDALETAVTVWVHLTTSEPWLEVRWASGVHLADDEDLEQRDLQADSIWHAVRHSGTLSARRMAEQLYGDAPRCLTYLDTPLRPPVPSLLSQQMTEMEPKDIGESLIALSGSKAHLDAERTLRGDVLMQRRTRDDSLSRAAEREREEAVTLQAIEDRDAARAALTEADSQWDLYVLAQYRKALSDDAAADEDVKDLGDKHADAAKLVTETEAVLAELKNTTDYATTERRARDAWTGAQQKTSGLRIQRAEVNKAHRDLVDERNKLLKDAAEWDGRPSTETAIDHARSLHDRNKAELKLESAHTAVAEAEKVLDRAENGRGGVAGLVLDTLESNGIEAASLFDVVEVDESERHAWEPRLLPYQDAVVVDHRLASPTLDAALAERPGAMVITTDELEGSFPDGVRCRLPITRFLQTLEARLEHRVAPDRVHDGSLSLTISGSFPNPIAGREALLGRLRRDVDDAVELEDQAGTELQLAEAALRLASAKHNCAVAAERLKAVNEEEDRLSNQIGEFDRAIGKASEDEAELQEAWEQAKGALDGHDQQVTLLKVRLENFQRDEREKRRKLRAREQERVDLDVEMWKALARGALHRYEGDLDDLPVRDLGTIRVAATDRLADAMRLFGIDDRDETLPTEMRDCIRLRKALAAGSGDRAPATDLPAVAEPLCRRLEAMAGQDRVMRTKIENQRAEHARVHQGLERELADGEQNLKVMQDMIEQHLEGILGRVSDQFDQLDRQRGGSGADLHVAASLPQGASEWVWEVTPRWRRSRGSGMVSYKEVANGAQVKVHAVQLVLAAVLADTETHGRVLVLDELGNSLGEVNRKDVLGALKRVAEDTQVTILGTCQDSVLVDAADVCGELMWFAHTSEAEAYNRPTRVWGFNANSEQVTLTADHLTAGRRGKGA